MARKPALTRELPRIPLKPMQRVLVSPEYDAFQEAYQKLGRICRDLTAQGIDPAGDPGAQFAYKTVLMAEIGLNARQRVEMENDGEQG